VEEMASPFESIPAELIVVIADELPLFRDLAALSRLSRRLHALFNPLLYRRAALSTPNFALFWAAATGQSRTLELVLGKPFGGRSLPFPGCFGRLHRLLSIFKTC
jgi:hypothetical protein